MNKTTDSQKTLNQRWSNQKKSARSPKSQKSDWAFTESRNDRGSRQMRGNSQTFSQGR